MFRDTYFVPVKTSLQQPISCITVHREGQTSYFQALLKDGDVIDNIALVHSTAISFKMAVTLIEGTRLLLVCAPFCHPDPI